MKNISLSILILVFTISNVRLTSQHTLENSTLWKIEGPELDKPSYLLGTIHLMCEEDFSIKQKVKQALKMTDNLVLEIDFADPDEIAYMQKSMMTGEKLSNKLTSHQAQQLDSLLTEKMNTGLQSFDQLSLMSIYSLVMTQSIVCPSKKMWEMELIALAKENNKDIHGLEKIEEQMDFFSKAFSDDELLNQILIMDDYTSLFDDMVKYYNSEELSKLYEVMDDDRFMNSETEYWLLEHRNKNWQNKMSEMMKTGSQLFAVGSAHLAGGYGMIKLLRDKGYSVTPVY